MPFIAKASGIPLAKIASRVMMGTTVQELRDEGMIPVHAASGFVAVKEALLPWQRFPEEDILLGPEMRATGEVMGIGADVGVAYAKALLSIDSAIPAEGQVFISLADRDKPMGLAAAQAFTLLGFKILATSGTARFLEHHGVDAEVVVKVGEGPKDTVERIESGEVHLVVNTPRGRRARGDGSKIRQASIRAGIPCITTIQGALAAARSLRSGPGAVLDVRSLQDWHSS